MKLPRLKKLRSLLILFAGIIICTLSPDARAQLPTDRQQIIEDILFIGNTKTQPEVFFRHMTIKPGDPVDIAQIEASLRSLEQTNFFKEVDFFTRPGSEKGLVVVIIEVRERKWPYFQFEGGHSDLDGWFLVPASLRFDNLLGQGNYIGLRMVLGHRIFKTALGFRTTNLFADHAFFSAELFAANQEFIHYFGTEEARQDVESSGLKLKFGGVKGAFKHLYVGFRAETYRPDPVAFLTSTGIPLSGSQLPADIRDDLEEIDIRSLSIGLHADTRDNPFFPLNGIWGAIEAETALDGFKGERSFSRITFDARFYKRVVNRTVLALHFKGGYATNDTPFYERFFLGGGNSLRGYSDSRLTPESWGTKLAVTSAEIRIPISKNNFPNHKSSLILFFDAGGIWLPHQSPELEDIFSAVGFGFRTRLPVVGTTRFDFSFPLRNVDNNDFQFHISLGHTF